MERAPCPGVKRPVFRPFSAEKNPQKVFDSSVYSAILDAEIEHGGANPGRESEGDSLV